MFFFIGGIQPKTVTLDASRRLCPTCGLVQAQLKRIDHYLSLFFIPLFPLKRGQPVLICDRCGAISPEEDYQRTAPPPSDRRVCPRCGARVESTFHYCPHCGSRI